ncbi:MAG: membrane protein insertase YidC [Alphaproteobacteria bacterium]
MEQRNLFLAIALSVVILLGSQLLTEELFPTPPVTTAETGGQAGQTVQASPAADSGGAIPQAPGGVVAPAATAAALAPTREMKLQESPRITIESPRISGSIALRGARIDDLVLKDYRVDLAEDASNVVLFSPSGAVDGYYAQFGWVGGTPDLKVPGDATVWDTTSSTLSPERPLELTWDNGEGLVFTRTIAIDKNYLFTVTDRVRATSSANGSSVLYPYGLIGRDGTPETSGFFILHEGPVGVMNGTLEEEDYDNLVDAPNGAIEYESTGGWIGITDKYWLSALMPDQSMKMKARMIHRAELGRDKYQTDYLGVQAMVVAPGSSIETTNHLFAGAKEVNLLETYKETFALPLFDRAVDFGYLWFFTKPLFFALDWLYGIVGNFGIAIMILTLGVKLVFFPLANKSYKAMSKMKLLQPEMVKMREKHGDDRTKMQQEMMAMYKREKVNPAAGCIPIVIQIPVFFALYKVLFVSIEMRHAPFFGWIKDLSTLDPSNIFEAFGYIPWGAPDFLHFGAWPLIMGLTMFLQQRLNPQPADPLQAKLFLFMPLIFTIFLAKFPAGLVIYWAWNNTLSICQQAIIMRRGRLEKERADKGRKTT